MYPRDVRPGLSPAQTALICVLQFVLGLSNWQSAASDILAGLLDHGATPLARLTIALAAIHAIPATEIRTARTVGLNLARGALGLRRGLLRRTLYLEELTHRVTTDWLTYRHQRWLPSANPHLQVSQRTALDPDRTASSTKPLPLATRSSS